MVKEGKGFERREKEGKGGERRTKEGKGGLRRGKEGCLRRALRRTPLSGRVQRRSRRYEGAQWPNAPLRLAPMAAGEGFGAGAPEPFPEALGIIPKNPKESQRIPKATEAALAGGWREAALAGGP